MHGALSSFPHIRFRQGFDKREEAGKPAAIDREIEPHPNGLITRAAFGG
jgi:hypothetical protein